MPSGVRAAEVGFSAKRRREEGEAGAGSHDVRASEFFGGCDMSYLISADCHVIEPPSTWAGRLPLALRDREPRVQRIEATPGLGADKVGQADWWHVGGKPVLPVFTVPPGLRVQQGGARDLPMEGSLGDMGGGIGTDEYSGADYVKDLARDNCQAAVLYPTVGLFFYSLEDQALQSAIFGAYNDFVAEFCTADPARLKGAAVIAVHDVQQAVKEMTRGREAGLVTAVLPVEPPVGTTYGDVVYEPLWAAASDLRMPITFHVATNQVRAQKAITQTTFVTFDNYVRTALSDLIFAGVFVRHANLRVVAAEFELGWIPFFLDRLDYTYTQRRRREGWIDLPTGVLPSDYWRLNCAASFQEDPTIAPEHWSLVGVDNIMIGTDFPHAESIFPESLPTAERVLSSLSEADRHKVLVENPSRFFDFAL
jgi:predicted TIM-barrel fold metal-dependent hydrolase